MSFGTKFGRYVGYGERFWDDSFVHREFNFPHMYFDLLKLIGFNIWFISVIGKSIYISSTC